MRKKIIVANWKSNPQTLSAAIRLARASDVKGVVLAPPYVYLEAVGRAVHNVALGAQDVYWENGGAHTGEISTGQLKNLKVKYVVLGHSERRALGESDVMIQKKVSAALGAGIRVILCVGEDIETRKRGLAAAKKFVSGQLRADLTGIPPRKLKNLIVAYEPIWAIGTGKADLPEESEEVVSSIKHDLIKKYRVKKPRVLYGGSVTSSNAAEFLTRPGINGALVGGASLWPKEFRKIVKAAVLPKSG